LSQETPQQNDRGEAKGGWKSKLPLILRVGVAVVLVGIILKMIDFRSVGYAIVNADPRWSILVVALALADRYLMAFKWAALLRSQGTPYGNWEAFKVYMSATFLGTVLPTSVGSDVYRAVRATLGGHEMNVITASIVLERVLGMLAVAMLSLCGLALLAGQLDPQFRVLLGIVVIFTLALLIAVRVSVDSRTFQLINKVAERFKRFKPARLIMDFHSAYVKFSHDRVVLGSFFALTFLEQVLNALFTYLGSQALGYHVPLIYFLALVPLSRFVTLLPISLGGIGVTEGAYVFAFALAGLSAPDALALAVYMRLVGWVILIPAGLVFLYDSIRFKREGRTATR
jgi:uncharacterized protein (TIRG00374 family)